MRQELEALRAPASAPSSILPEVSFEQHATGTVPLAAPDLRSTERGSTPQVRARSTIWAPHARSTHSDVLSVASDPGVTTFLDTLGVPSRTMAHNVHVSRGVPATPIARSDASSIVMRIFTDVIRTRIRDSPRKWASKRNRLPEVNGWKSRRIRLVASFVVFKDRSE